MPRTDSNADSEIVSTTDIAVAGAYNEFLTTHTDTGEFEDLPDHLRIHLDTWVDHYMRRRRAERGVSPIASQLIQIFQPDSCHWVHRADPEQLGPRRHSFATRSTQTTLIQAPTVDIMQSVTNSMQRYGWQVMGLWDGDEDYALKIGFSTTVYDFEVLRRLLVAGLTDREALAIWARDVVDLRRAGGSINEYLDTAGRQDDATTHLADALETPVNELTAAADRATQTLQQIDSDLPQFLADGRGGQPLPNQLLSTTELEQLRHRRKVDNSTADPTTRREG